MSVIARSISIAVGDWGAKACPLCGIARCPLFRGCFTIGVCGATIRTWVIVHYKGGVRSSEVSVKRGSTVMKTPLNVKFCMMVMFNTPI